MRIAWKHWRSNRRRRRQSGEVDGKGTACKAEIDHLQILRDFYVQDLKVRARVVPLKVKARVKVAGL